MARSVGMFLSSDVISATFIVSRAQTVLQSHNNLRYYSNGLEFGERARAFQELRSAFECAGVL